MSKDRRQQKHRCTMMLEKTRMIKHREKGQTYTKNKNNKLQNKRTLITELKQQMDLKNANKDLSTNIASNTLKKTEKQRKHEQTHTQTQDRKKQHRKTHTHTENQKLRGKHAHTHKKQQRINIIYSAHAQKQQQIKAHEHMTVVGAARETCATGCLACFEFWMQHVQKPVIESDSFELINLSEVFGAFYSASCVHPHHEI